MPSRKFRTVVLFVSLVASGAVLYVVWATRLLRPIADDYCFAASAGQGFLGSMNDWFTRWSGDMFGIGVNVVLVGMPLVHLPFSLASAIPFLLSALMSVVVVALLLRGARAAGASRSLRWYAATVPVLALAWWAFWWVPITLGNPALNVQPTAYAMTFWQNINAGNTAVLFLMTGWLLIARIGKTPALAGISAVVLGILTGLSGPVLAVAAVAVTAAYACLDRDGTSAWAARRWLMVPSFVAGALLGVLVTRLSPGAVARSSQIIPTVSPLSPANLFKWTFPNAFQEWLTSVASGGTAVVLVLGIVVGLLVRSGGIELRPSSLAHAASWLLALALAIDVFARLSEAFAYEAYWHYIPARTIVYLAAICAGVALSAPWLGERASLVTGAQVAVGIIGLTMAISAVLVMSSAIGGRAAQWEQGPAPVQGIVDIETPGSWVDQCWVRLGEYRELPSRGGSN